MNIDVLANTMLPPKKRIRPRLYDSADDELPPGATENKQEKVRSCRQCFIHGLRAGWKSHNCPFAGCRCAKCSQTLVLKSYRNSLKKRKKGFPKDVTDSGMDELEVMESIVLSSKPPQGPHDLAVIYAEILKTIKDVNIFKVMKFVQAKIGLEPSDDLDF